MTRQHHAQFYCPNCKTFHTAESAFGRWIRNNKALDSGSGFCVVDVDYWVHRFKVHGNRGFQCMMMIEIKSFGAVPSDAQNDTLWMIDQTLRNRRDTPTKESRRQSGSGPLKVRSHIAKRDVFVKNFGVHVLTFSGIGPDDSESITWDKKPIDTDTLTKILRFDLDPDTLKPIDLRNHHQTHENKVLSLPLHPVEGAA